MTNIHRSWTRHLQLRNQWHLSPTRPWSAQPGADRLVPRRPRSTPSHGLDRVEVVLFLFGVSAFAVLMLAFGQPLAGSSYLPIVAGGIISCFTFECGSVMYMSHRCLTSEVV